MQSSVRVALVAVALAALGLVAVVLALAGDEEPALPFATGVAARPADRFVDSVGVNVHLSYRDTAYGDFEQVAEALGDLGVRHIRDYPLPQNVDEINELAESGIGLTAVMGTPEPRSWMPHDLEELFAVVRDDIRPAVVAVEGANEWDISDEEDWADQLRAHQERLWELVRGDDVTEDLPVIAPAITWAANMPEAGDLSAWADVGNIHPYPGGEVPEGRVTDDTRASQASNVAGAPVVVTETGYHNAVGHGDGHPGVPEEVAAAYLPQLLLHHFSIGVPRTFAYELVDLRDDPEDRESSFGLLRADFTPKPAYTAVRHLLELLEDPGPGFRPGRLDYEVEGGDGDTRHLLLQRRDGTFLLAVWQATSIWDVDGQRPERPGSRPVTVVLAQPIEEGRVWVLGDGEPQRLEAPTSVALEASASVQVVELVPGQLNAPEQQVARSPSSPSPGGSRSTRRRWRHGR